MKGLMFKKGENMDVYARNDYAQELSDFAVIADKFIYNESYHGNRDEIQEDKIPLMYMAYNTVVDKTGYIAILEGYPKKYYYINYISFMPKEDYERVKRMEEQYGYGE